MATNQYCNDLSSPPALILYPEMDAFSLAYKQHLQLSKDFDALKKKAAAHEKEFSRLHVQVQELTTENYALKKQLSFVKTPLVNQLKQLKNSAHGYFSLIENSLKDLEVKLESNVDISKETAEPSLLKSIPLIRGVQKTIKRTSNVSEVLEMPEVSTGEDLSQSEPPLLSSVEASTPVGPIAAVGARVTIDLETENNEEGFLVPQEHVVPEVEKILPDDSNASLQEKPEPQSEKQSEDLAENQLETQPELNPEKNETLEPGNTEKISASLRSQEGPAAATDNEEDTSVNDATILSQTKRVTQDGDSPLKKRKKSDLPENKISKNTVTVKLEVLEAKRKYVFKIKRTTRFYKLMDNVADKVHVSVDRIRFFSGNKVIDPRSTPQKLGVEDHQLLDISVELVDPDSIPEGKYGDLVGNDSITNM